MLDTLWALLPCGLLYSALVVAALAGSVLGGAAVMAAFAIGTSVTMTAAPWVWLRLRGSPHIPGSGTGVCAWRVRLWPRVRRGPCGWAWSTTPRRGAPRCKRYFFPLLIICMAEEISVDTSVIFPGTMSVVLASWATLL